MKLFLPIERNQLKWFGLVIRTSPRCLPVEVFQVRPPRGKPRGRLRAHWEDYISHLTWEYLGIPQKALGEVAREKGIWTSLLGLLPPRL